MQKAKISQRGEMSRLAIEIKAGVFVATINARVRDQLWKRMTEEWKNPCIMIHSTNNEQGYSIRSYGDPARESIDFDGITLLAKPLDRMLTTEIASESENENDFA